MTDPDLVVVLEPSLVRELDVAEGLHEEGLILVNGTDVPLELSGLPVRCVPAARSPNLVMLGAVAAALGEPSLAELQEAAVEMLGSKVAVEEVRAALAEGYTCLR